MEIKEIRIGNLVQMSNKDWHELEEDVKLEDNNNIWEIEVINTDGDISIRNSIENLFEFTTIDEIEPIPLTEQWLLKFGFEEEKESDNFSKWWIGENPLTHDWLFLIKQHKSTNIFFYENGYNKVKSIHHLQNLFNAITQTELTINN